MSDFLVVIEVQRFTQFQSLFWWNDLMSFRASLLYDRRGIRFNPCSGGMTL